MAATEGTSLKGVGPQSRYVKIQGREMHYTEWGSPGARPVMMWHGLARTGRDFDFLARKLADRFHIVCPDTIGRGLSEWSDKPDSDYCFDVYARHAAELADVLGWKTLDWVGTSMGGSLGMRVGATTLAGRIRRLVINDIGPTFPVEPFERIKTYVGSPSEFSTMGELITYFQTIYAPFGHHTDAQWRHFAETSMRRLPSGKVTAHYDPAIVRQLFSFPNDFELWDCWDRITAPTLVLHGESSDLLLPAIAADMARRGPKAQVVDITGCGHAPALNVTSQTAIVAQFLDAA
ncbi:MAG: alpha/beta fold hydrolase [Hyphomicrobiaceae bacterium]